MTAIKNAGGGLLQLVTFKVEGDEFGVAAEGLDETAALALAQRVQEALAAPSPPRAAACACP